MDPVRIERTIPAPLDRVYAAWTDAGRMSRWFFPGQMTCEAECDFRVGGSYRLVMRGGDTNYPHHGIYREIVDREKIVFTWSSHRVTDTLVTINFSGDDRQTRIELVHELITDPEAAAEHRQGWNGCLDNLNEHVVGRREEVSA